MLQITASKKLGARTIYGGFNWILDLSPDLAPSHGWGGLRGPGRCSINQLNLPPIHRAF